MTVLTVGTNIDCYVVTNQIKLKLFGKTVLQAAVVDN